MTVISVEKDVDSLSLTLVAEFEAPIERVWQLWDDPRQLERWWGPPTHPATVEKHDLAAGGEVAYFMTGPEGEQSRGWWRVTSVDPPKSLEFTDGFANPDGTPNAKTPTTAVQVRLTEQEAGRGWSCASPSTPPSTWTSWSGGARSRCSPSRSARWTPC